MRRSSLGRPSGRLGSGGRSVHRTGFAGFLKGRLVSTPAWPAGLWEGESASAIGVIRLTRSMGRRVTDAGFAERSQSIFPGASGEINRRGRKVLKNRVRPMFSVDDSSAMEKPLTGK